MAPRGGGGGAWVRPKHKEPVDRTTPVLIPMLEFFSGRSTKPPVDRSKIISHQLQIQAALDDTAPSAPPPPPAARHHSKTSKGPGQGEAKPSNKQRQIAAEPQFHTHRPGTSGSGSGSGSDGMGYEHPYDIDEEITPVFLRNERPHHHHHQRQYHHHHHRGRDLDDMSPPPPPMLSAARRPHMRPRANYRATAVPRPVASGGGGYVSSARMSRRWESATTPLAM